MVDVVTSIDELNKTSMALILGIKAVTAAINGIKKGIEFFDKTQKEAIKFGLDAKQVESRLGDSINQLNGSIDRKLNTSIATLNAGIAGNIGSVNSLINEQQILGQSYQRTATIFGKLEATAGLNNSQLDSLAKTVNKNSSQYSRSTEFLVGALDQLSDQFTSLSLQENLSEPIFKAYTELAGQLGPAYEGSLARAFKTLLDPTFDTIQKRALFGISGFEDLLFNLRDSEQAIAAFKQAFATAKDTVMQFRGGVFSREVIRSIFRREGEDIVVVARALEDLTDKKIEEYKEEAKTNQLFSTALEKIFDPLKQMIIDAAPAFAQLAENLDASIEAIYGTEGFRGLINNVSNILADMATNIQNITFALLEWLNKDKTFLPTIKFGGDIGDLFEARRLFEQLKNPAPALVGYATAGFGSPGMPYEKSDPTELVKSSTMRELEELAKKQGKTVDKLREWSEGFNFDRFRAELKKISEPAKDTADNTAALLDAMTGTTSQFFQETGDIFARSAAAILGFTPGQRNHQEELVELTRTLVEIAAQPSLINLAEGI